MGCGGSSEAAAVKEVEVETETAQKVRVPGEPQELYKKAVTPALPMGHDDLTALIDLLDGGGDKIASWLKEIDETRARRKAIEAATDDAPFSDFCEWVSVVKQVFSDEAVSIAKLEKAWGVTCSTTEIEEHVATGKVRALRDEEVEAYRSECPVPSGLALKELYERAVSPSLPKGHERLEALISVLREADPKMTYGWLKEIDETRSRRKAIEAATDGAPFKEFRVWIAIVESQLSKEVVSIANLEKAWQVGKYAKDELPQEKI